jgi:hypothetical protein
MLRQIIGLGVALQLTSAVSAAQVTVPIGPGSGSRSGSSNQPIGLGSIWPIGPSASGSATVPYIGPGDLIPGATAWWGLRAYNAAYAASLGKIVNVCTPADATCADVKSDAAGNFNIAGTPSLTCNNSTSICTIKTLYDQTGALNCDNGSPNFPCDVTNATIANRPILVLNCLGTLPCMGLNGFQSLRAQDITYPSQPFTISATAESTGSPPSGIRGVIYGDSGNAILLAFDRSAANNAELNCGTQFVVNSIADNSFHALQGICNAASSILYIDGTSYSGNAGTQFVMSMPIVGAIAAGQNILGRIVEVGLWPVGLSPSQQSSMNTNQHAYWGF